MTDETNAAEPSGASGGSMAKPSGAAASQAAAFFVDIGMQEIVEGFEPVKLPQWEMVGKATDGAPIYRNNWGEYRRWIPVTERLPEEGVVVLAFLPKQADVEGGVYAAMLSGLQTLKGTFSTSFGFGFEATHWMPLPAPPTDAK